MKPGLDLKVDWNSVPLFRSYFPECVPAIHRSGSANPELPALRKQALKTVVGAFDGVLKPKGYARNGNRWSKGPGGAMMTHVDEEFDPGGLVTSFAQFKQRLKAALLRKPAVAILPGISSAVGNDGSVYVALQKSKYGHGFFVNVGIRPVLTPRAGEYANELGAFREFRLQNFLAELPATNRLDEFLYVRLMEDERLMRLLMHVLEKRIVPWLEMYAKPITGAPYPPTPAEMTKAGPLPFGIND